MLFLWWVHCNYPLNLLEAVQIRDSWGFWRGRPVHTEGPAPRSHSGSGCCTVHTVCFNPNLQHPHPNMPNNCTLITLHGKMYSQDFEVKWGSIHIKLIGNLLLYLYMYVSWNFATCTQHKIHITLFSSEVFGWNSYEFSFHMIFV